MKLLDKINLYDKGYVKLYDVSSIKNKQDVERLVSNIAGICYDKDVNKNIFDLLLRKGHLSPFEFVRVVNLKKKLNGKIKDSLRNNFKIINFLDDNIPEEHRRKVALFEVKIPIFVARQLMRHRSFSYMELSRRYVKDNISFYTDIDLNPDFSVVKSCDVETFFNAVKIFYKELLANGIPKEQARIVLPVGLYTRIFIMVEADGFLNFAIQRLNIHAQKEIRDLCKNMIKLLYNKQKEFENIEKLYQIVTCEFIGDWELNLNDFNMNLTVQNGLIVNCNVSVVS